MVRLRSVRLQCDADGCEATRQGHPTRESSLRASLNSLRLKLRSVGWSCIDNTDTDYCPLHVHLASNQETA